MRDFLREDVLIKALKLAVIATAAVAPNMLDSYFHNPGYREAMLAWAKETSLPFLFARDLLLVFFALLVSSACGFAWSDGKKVAGFGTIEGLRKDLGMVVILGIALAVATAFLFDRGLTGDFPKLYPQNPVLVLAIPLRSAFFEEVVCRFGMLVILFRLFRSVPAAIVLSAAFNASIGLKSAVFVGFPVGLDWLTAIIIVSKLGVASFFGWFFCKKGLMATITLQFIIELKHMVLAFV